MIVKVQVIPQETITVHVDTVTRTSSNDVPVYDGPYEAIPKVEAQTLPTAKKLMTDDVTVRKIPRYEVSNDCDGVTLIIGDEYFNG